MLLPVEHLIFRPESPKLNEILESSPGDPQWWDYLRQRVHQGLQTRLPQMCYGRCERKTSWVFRSHTQSLCLPPNNPQQIILGCKLSWVQGCVSDLYHLLAMHLISCTQTHEAEFGCPLCVDGLPNIDFVWLYHFTKFELNGHHCTFRRIFEWWCQGSAETWKKMETLVVTIKTYRPKIW